MTDGNNQQPSYPEVKLKRPEAEMRAEMMANPDVQEQARLLKMPLEQFVEKMLDYAKHPSKPPQLIITPDEELKKQDPRIPTVGELEAHLEKLKSGEISISPAHRRDGFSNTEKAPADYEVALGSAESLKGQRVDAKDNNLEVKKDSTFKP